MDKNSVVFFSITLISFCIGIFHRVWMTSTAVAEMRHNLEKQDMRLENLSLLHDAGFQGFKERIEHASARTREELNEQNRRLEDIEGYLTKSTDFTRRR